MPVWRLLAEGDTVYGHSNSEKTGHAHEAIGS